MIDRMRLYNKWIVGYILNVLCGIYVKVDRNIFEREYILKNSKDFFYLYYR